MKLFYTNELDEAFQYTSELQCSSDTNSLLIFLLHCHCYLVFLDIIQKIHQKQPHARIVIFDDKQRPGGCLLTAFCNIHGCCLTIDTPREKERCLLQVARGIPATSKMAKHLFEVDLLRGALTHKEKAITQIFLNLTGREWDCFRLSVMGHDLSEISKRMELQYFSARNLHRRMLKKFNVKNQVELLQKSHQLGLTD